MAPLWQKEREATEGKSGTHDRAIPSGASAASPYAPRKGRLCAAVNVWQLPKEISDKPVSGNCSMDCLRALHVHKRRRPGQGAELFPERDHMVKGSNAVWRKSGREDFSISAKESYEIAKTVKLARGCLEGERPNLIVL